MKFWGVSQKKIGEFGSEILWRFGVARGVAKMFEHIFGKMIGTASKKLK